MHFSRGAEDYMPGPTKKKVVKKTPSVINPKHYALVVNGQPIEMVDILEARFADDMHLAFAVQYLFRAGHKADASYVKDVGKAIWWLVRALMANKVKHIELPPGAPVK